jgi:alcohol dehydrogenase
MAAGILKKLEEILQKNKLSYDYFQEVEPDPAYETAISAAEMVKKINADLIIGIGGGSPLDIAKVSAVLATNEKPISELFGIDQIPDQGIKTILVPTTAGTGSEVTPIAILSDEAEKLKKGIVSHHLLPAVSILDPELLLGLPADVTAATGMDALIHAIEAFTSKNANSISDMFARQAMKLVFENIHSSYLNGADIKARACMLEGSLLAGMAFANAGVTAVHAFAYPIGAEFHIPHGIANSIMLPPVLRFNMHGNLAKFGEMARIFGRETTGLNDKRAALQMIEAIDNLVKDLNLPNDLGKFGVCEEHIPELSKSVMKVTRLLANNPRKLTPADAERIYMEALKEPIAVLN